MNLLCDEGVDAQIVQRLREDGHQVVYIAELDPGVDDETVLHQANMTGALLITADKDFGEIVHRQGRIHTGVLLLRLAGLSCAVKAGLVAGLISRHGDELHGAFSVASPGALRVRHPLTR